MMIENNLPIKHDIYKKLLIVFLKILLIIVPLFAYKYVYNFRVNQETGLKLFILLLITICLIKIANTGEISLRRTKLSLFMFLFALVLLFSLFISNSKVVSFQELLLFLSYIIFFFLITNHVKNNKDFNTFIYLFFIISFLISTYTLVQYYGLDPYLSDLHRLSSTIGQKNWISNYIAMVFPIAFSYFLLEKNNKKIKSVYFLLLTILYVTLLICQSRGIWISIGLTLILATFIITKFKLWELFKKNKQWLVCLLFVFLIATVTYSTENPLNKSRLTVAERAISTFDKYDPSINTRLLIWRTTLEMIKNYPVAGSGIGTFRMNYLKYQAGTLDENPHYIKYSNNAEEAHNEYLQMWAEIGIIGLGIFLIIIIIIYSQFWKFFKRERDNKRKIIGCGLILGISCYLFHSLFTFPLHVPALASTFFVIVGLGMVYMNKFNLPEIKIKTGIDNFTIKFFLNIFFITLMIVTINCLAIKPYIAELYYFTGIRHNVDKNYTQSLPNFECAAQLDPYNGRILHALGTTYNNLEMYTKADDILQKAKKYIVDVNTYRNLGLVYTQTAQNKKAEEEFKQAVFLDPKFYKAYNDLASLYVYQNEYEKAIEQWEKAIELNLDFEEKHIFLYYIGMAYQRMDKPDKALEYFIQALQLAPEGSPIIEEIEEEIYNIYKGKLNS